MFRHFSSHFFMLDAPMRACLQVPTMGLVSIIDHWSSPIYLIHICSCILCGHVYGRSCLEKLLRPSGKESAKVPWVILYILGEQIELNCSTYAWILYFLTSALSVAKDLWRSLLSTSTHQKTCWRVAAVRRSCFFQPLYISIEMFRVYIYSDTH